MTHRNSEKNNLPRQLENAIRNGMVHEVVTLLDRDPSLINSRSYDKQTPLMLACSIEQVKIVEYLFEHKVESILIDDYGKCAFSYVIESGSMEMFNIFLKWNVPITKFSKPDPKVEYSYEKKIIPLICTCAEFNRLEMLSILFENGINLQESNKKNETALMISAQKNNVEVIEFLLGHGVSINSLDSDQNTALFAAIYNKSVEAAHLLISEGANLYTQNRYGLGPIGEAASKGMLSTLSLFIEKGVPVDLAQDHGSSPLYLAAAHSRTDCVQYLLRCGAKMLITKISRKIPH